jgi:HlyD family secretion protein
MKLIIIIVAAMGLALGLASGLTVWLKRNAATSGMGTPVRLEEVRPTELIEIVSAPGTIEPERKVSISAKIAARVVELPYKEGAVVAKGNPDANPPVPPSVLIRLDARDMQAQLRATEARRSAQAANIDVAQAHIESQKAQIASQRVMLADAEREMKRAQFLIQRQDVSQQSVDQAQAKFDQLKAALDSAVASLTGEDANLKMMTHQLEAADAEIQRAKDDLSYTVITSPIDGIVTTLNAEVGELVVTGTMNNPGTVIMEVADLNTMLFKARIPESSIASVKVGQKAIVRVPAYQDREFDGVVQTVALANTEEKDGTKYFKTEVLLKTNGDRVLQGLTADVDIETKRHQNVMAVPSQAVVARTVDDLPTGVRDAKEVERNKTQTPVVYRMKDGKAVVTPVTVGPSDLQRTVITSGLSAGDVIVVGPYKTLDKIQNDDLIKDEKATTQPSSTTKPS